MISPEILRRFPYFSGLNSSQLQALADITEQISFGKGTTIFEESQPANNLYLLVSGVVDLFYKSEEEFRPQSRKEFSVGEINPGEPFGLSALLEPHVLTATARASQSCQVLEIDAVALRGLCEKDHDLALLLMVQTAKALVVRLTAVRVQLAAAWG